MPGEQWKIHVRWAVFQKARPPLSGATFPKQISAVQCRPFNSTYGPTDAGGPHRAAGHAQAAPGTARHGIAPRTRSPHLGLQTHPPRSQQRHQGGSAVPAGWQQLRPEGCAGVGYGPAAGRGGSCVSRSLSPRPSPLQGRAARRPVAVGRAPCALPPRKGRVPSRPAFAMLRYPGVGGRSAARGLGTE